MKNYSDTFQTHSKQLKNEITSNRNDEIRKMLADRKLLNLKMNDPNKEDSTDASEVSLFNIIERFISIDHKKFSKEDLMTVCAREPEIIEILSLLETKQRNKSQSTLIDSFLKEQKSKNSEVEEDLGKLADQIAIKKEDDTLLQYFNDEIK